MATKWTDQQRQIAKVVLGHRREEGSGYDFSAVQQELPNVSKGRISEVAKALRENGWAIPAGTPAKEKKQSSGPGKRVLINITSRKPAPILFTIGEHDIGLDTEPLYESYLLYEDLKVRYGFTDSFSVVLKDAMAICYRLLVD